MNPQTDERGGLSSASKLERIYHCAGSPLADPPKTEQDDLDESDNAVRDAGTRIHDALRDDDFSNLPPDESLIAIELKKMAQDELFKWVWYLDPNAGPPEKRNLPEPVKEHRVWIRRRDNLKPVSSAQLDRYYILGDAALVIDTKTGFLPTSHATENIQLRAQALALWQEFPNLKRIRVAINQFRLRQHRTHADYSLTDLKLAEEELMFRLFLAQQPDAPRVPGHWCLYCPAKSSCVEAQTFSLMPSAKLPPERDGLSIEQRVALLTPQNRKFIWQQSRVIKKVLDAVNDSLKAMSAEELEKLGLVVTPPQNVRSVSNILEAYSRLDKAGFLKGDDIEKAQQFSQYCKMPLGAIEESLTEHFISTDGGTKKDAKAKSQDVLAPLVVITTKAGFLKEI
jgi:hypothetical protein